MGNVIVLNNVTRLPIPVDRVLDAASAADLESVVIVGTTKDGQEYFSSSEADGGSVLWDLERAKLRLLRIADSQVDGDV